MEKEEKIVFTEDELIVIEKYLDGKIQMFGTSEEDMKVMSGILHRADDLRRLTNADDGDDMVRWYYAKYLEQNGFGTEEIRNKLGDS